jgi:hypothetical protein
VESQTHLVEGVEENHHLMEVANSNKTMEPEKEKESLGNKNSTKEVVNTEQTMLVSPSEYSLWGRENKGVGLKFRSKTTKGHHS